MSLKCNWSFTTDHIDFRPSEVFHQWKINDTGPKVRLQSTAALGWSRTMATAEFLRSALWFGISDGRRVWDYWCATSDIIWLVVSNIFYFHPYLGKIPNLTNIFSDGLKPPTSYCLYTTCFQLIWGVVLWPYDVQTEKGGMRVSLIWSITWICFCCIPLGS